MKRAKTRKDPKSWDNFRRSYKHLCTKENAEGRSGNHGRNFVETLKLPRRHQNYRKVLFEYPGIPESLVNPDDHFKNY